MLVGGAKGEVQLFHVTSRRCLWSTVETDAETNEVNALSGAEYRPDGLYRATAGVWPGAQGWAHQ